MQGVQVQSLAWKLRSHLPSLPKKQNIDNRSDIVINPIKTLKMVYKKKKILKKREREREKPNLFIIKLVVNLPRQGIFTKYLFYLLRGRAQKTSSYEERQRNRSPFTAAFNQLGMIGPNPFSMIIH